MVDRISGKDGKAAAWVIEFPLRFEGDGIRALEMAREKVFTV